MVQRDVLNVAEVVIYCRSLVSEWLIRQEINAGRLPSFRIGRRILVDRIELDKFIEEKMKESIKPKGKNHGLTRAK